MLWVLSAAFFLVWFVAKVFLHKSGFVHLILLWAIGLFVVQFAAYRRARQHNTPG